MPEWRLSTTSGYPLSRCRGVSLIPVMVSIAIFTAIALQYTIPQQQWQQRQNRIEIAQISAAQILAAALEYRVNESGWPANSNDLVDYLPIVNNNPWGNGWVFLPVNGGLVLATQAEDNLEAIALAARFGAIARICNNGINLCDPPQNNGTWVHIGIAPP